MEKGIIITRQTKNTEYVIKELTNLALTSNIEIAYSITQNFESPNKTFYVGKGKIDEIKTVVESLDIEIAIFNTELTPSQLKNIEDYLDIKVIDRSMLILDIFSKRAKTKQAMLEVELAQLKYFLPRLSGMKNFTRQGGSSGSFSAKGPGEKKLELDKRKIYKEIDNIKKELLIIKQRRMIEKKNRIANNIPLVALVGYTNSGKSTTLNTLLSITKSSNKDVLSEDMLFATIDTQARKIVLDDNQEVILIDTVGFVSDLPNHLIESFKSTLEGIQDADLIIHVVDVTNQDKELQIETTNQVLKEIGVLDKKILYLYNKADLITDGYYMEYTPGFLFSNRKEINHRSLLEYLKEELSKNKIYKELLIPYGKEKIISILKENANIVKMNKEENGIKINVYLSEKTLREINKIL